MDYADNAYGDPVLRAKHSEYVALETELDGFRILRNDRAVADAAMRAIGELAEHSDGYHRVPLTDALIAAAAAEHGGIAVLLAMHISTSSPKSSRSRTSSFRGPDPLSTTGLSSGLGRRRERPEWPVLVF